ncbi:MAG: diguanylate cyclase domain-containing protein, partial [Acidimicrobiales bacterium]
MPRRFRLLLALVVGSGAASILAALPDALSGDVPPAWRLVLAGALFALGDICLLKIRFGHNHHSFTWSETALVAGLVLVPSPWLRIIAPLAVGAAHAAARRSPLKVAFNAMSIATEVLLARLVLEAVAPAGAPVDDPRLWAGLVLAAATLFVWNGLTVSAAVAFSQGLRLRQVYLKGLLLNGLVWGGNTAIGVLLVALSGSPAALVVFPALVVMLYISYRSYLGAMNERDTWQVLQKTSRELLQADPRDVARVVLDRAPALFQAEFVELVVVDGETGYRMAVHRWTGERVEELSGDPAILAGAFWPRVLSERETFQITTRTAPARLREELEVHGLEACAIAPLLSQQGCMGALRIGFRGAVQLNRREVQVLTTFASHVGSALHNTYLIDELRDQALKDPLTGLPNRTLLLDRLSHALKRLRRRPGGVAILFCDVDRFKVVNDSLGHQAGDELLVAVARRIESGLRAGDAAARFGGDEFVVVCEEVDTTAILRIAERVTEAIQAPLSLYGRDAVITASVGVAVVAGGARAEDVLRDADVAMYRAKERGRARIEIFDSAIRARLLARLETEQALRRALREGQLRLHYQPIVRSSDTRLLSVEALV